MFLIVFLSQRFWLIFPSSLMFGSCLSVYWLKEGKVPHMNISRHNMPPKSLISDVEYERVSPLIYAYVSFFSSSKVGYHSGPPVTWADFGISCDDAKWFAACHFRSSFRSIFSCCVLIRFPWRSCVLFLICLGWKFSDQRDLSRKGLTLWQHRGINDLSPL